MVAQPPIALQWMDAFSALGLGLLLAAFYDALRFVAGRSKPLVFLCDLAGFAAAAVAAVSFGVSYSYTGFLRWYMLAGMTAGCAAYFFAVGPFTAALRRALLRVVTAPFRLAAALVLRPVAQSILRRHKASVKKRKEKKKSAKHPLQEGGKVLYNSN